MIDDYIRASANRAELPDFSLVSIAHEQYVKARYSHLNAPETFRLLEEQVRK